MTARTVREVIDDQRMDAQADLVWARNLIESQKLKDFAPTLGEYRLIQEALALLVCQRQEEIGNLYRFLVEVS